MTKNELKYILVSEKQLYLGNQRSKIMLLLFPSHRVLIWRCLFYFRKMQFYFWLKRSSTKNSIKSFFTKFAFYYYNMRYIKYSMLSTVEIDVNSYIGKNCNIWHGSVVINGILGDNCVLHGQNTIGNKGIGREEERPIIGNGVDCGVGAKIIGNVRIADNVLIGANSVVIKSIIDKGSIVAGVPSHIIKNET